MRSPHAGPADHEPREETVRLLTYNVHGFRGSDGRLRPKRVLDVIRQAQPDIVALQEVNGLAALEYLSEQLSMRHFFSAARERMHVAFGNALLSALPAERVKEEALPRLDPGSEARCAQWVRFSVAWGVLEVINTHLGLSRAERAIQVEALLGNRWLAANDVGPFALLCGDLNARPNSPAFCRLCKHLRDVQAAVLRKSATFPAMMPVWRIDHVLLTHTLVPKAVVVPSGILARLASDHRPLIVDISPKAEHP